MLKIKVNSSGEKSISFSDRSLEKGQVNGKDFSLDSFSQKEGRFHILREARSYTAEILKYNPEEKTIELLVNGNKYRAQISDQYDALLKSLGIEGSGKSKINNLKAPMPGMVLNVMVNEGSVVKKGDAVLVLEAMKMENILKSPSDGTIKKVNVKKGTAVEKNQVLLHFA